ncbi:MAG: DUF5050 domain-containing protein [Bacteroidales bacterium]|nr:DUF5050 domain-containing protein [Bacteroidales bacterium]
MKKFALYIVLALLLLSLGNNINLTEENIVLGSDPGNIQSHGHVTEDEAFIYYTSAQSDVSIYRATTDFSKKTEIIKTTLGAHFLNTHEDYIYFVDGLPGFLWKIKKDGSEKKKPVLFRNMTNVIISGNRIYYRLNLIDGLWFKAEWIEPFFGTIYSCDLNGGNKKLISKENILRFVIDNNFIYYSDESYALWRMDTLGNNKENIYPTRCSLPEFDEKYLYFSDGNGVYRMDKESLQKEVITEQALEARNLHGDWIYYTKDREGDIYRISKDGKRKELLLESDVVAFNIAGNSIFFELYNDGFYRFDIETRRLTKLSDH